MDNEIELLLKEAETERVDTIAGTDYHVGTLRGKLVVIAKAGIGKIRVASGITALLEHYPVSQVIFTGIAGAAAAVVCMKYDKPFVVIRALSDKADGNAHESYEGFGDIACLNSSKIVLGMLDSIGAQK